MACGIRVPRQGLEPRPLAAKVQNANHWTRENPISLVGNASIHYGFRSSDTSWNIESEEHSNSCLLAPKILQQRKLGTEELILLNCCVGEDS